MPTFRTNIKASKGQNEKRKKYKCWLEEKVYNCANTGCDKQVKETLNTNTKEFKASKGSERLNCGEIDLVFCSERCLKNFKQRRYYTIRNRQDKQFGVNQVHD